MESNWKVIFKGEILPGFDQDAVKLELIQLLKLNEEKARKLFSRRPIILKKELSLDTAEYYKSSFELKGIKVYLEQESKTLEVNGYTLRLQPAEKQSLSESGDDFSNRASQSSYFNTAAEQHTAKVDADFSSDDTSQCLNESCSTPSGVDRLYSDHDAAFVKRPPILAILLIVFIVVGIVLILL